MSTLQWEYCELALDGSKEHREGYSHNVWINYLGASGSRRFFLAERDGKNRKIWSGASPFRQAFALLGVAGWELVSHQYANHSGAAGTMGTGIMWDQRSAIFKRPVQPGRAVDDFDLVAYLKVR